MKKSCKKEHGRCLVLNTDYTAISSINWQDAITLVFKDLVYVVETYKSDKILCAGDRPWDVPAVIVLRDYIQQSKRRTVPFSRKNVFIRDRLTCQYCLKKFPPGELTFDHVIPRSKWTKKTSPTNWTNIVTCCYSCNNEKADLLLSETKLKLKRIPSEPSPHGFVLGLAPWKKIHPKWKKYLPKHYVQLFEGMNWDNIDVDDDEEETCFKST